MPKRCPICGEPLKDGLCIACGYDAYTNGFDEGPTRSDSHKKKHTSLIDDILDFATDASDDF